MSAQSIPGAKVHDLPPDEVARGLAQGNVLLVDVGLAGRASSGPCL